MKKIKLGSTVRDMITGFTGIVMARTEYLTDCVHLGISVMEIPKEGKIPDWEWIDERRCFIIKTKGIVKLQEPVKVESNGGDMQNAPEM